MWRLRPVPTIHTAVFTFQDAVYIFQQLLQSNTYFKRNEGQNSLNLILWRLQAWDVETMVKY